MKIALEIKGEQLIGNDDTEYKRKVFKAMTESFAAQKAQQENLAGADTTSVLYELVPIEKWKLKLPALMANIGSSS